MAAIDHQDMDADSKASPALNTVERPMSIEETELETEENYASQARPWLAPHTDAFALVKETTGNLK